MTNKHEPDREFQERLEWQLKSELRRLEAFDMQERNGSQWMKRLKIAAMVMLAIALGAAGARAAEYYRDSWKSDLLMARAEAQMELARVRFGAFAEMAEETREQFAIGEASRIDLDYIRREVNQRERDFLLAQLDFREIEESGQQSDRSLYADLVDGHDFVTEALEIERQFAQRELHLLIEHRDWLAAEQAPSKQELNTLDIAIAEAERQMRETEDKLQLRREFLAGDLTAEDAQIREELVTARQRVQVLEQQLRQLLEEYERVASRNPATEDEPYLRYLTLELRQQEARLRLAQREIEILEAAR